jgi:hypothetical protein
LEQESVLEPLDTTFEDVQALSGDEEEEAVQNGGLNLKN